MDRAAWTALLEPMTSAKVNTAMWPSAYIFLRIAASHCCIFPVSWKVATAPAILPFDCYRKFVAEDLGAWQRDNPAQFFLPGM
jgi:hypothetical protein